MEDCREGRKVKDGRKFKVHEFVRNSLLYDHWFENLDNESFDLEVRSYLYGKICLTYRFYKFNQPILRLMSACHTSK